MPNINITVAAKIATNTTPGEVIVCGNSDYTVTFAFDSEWDAETERTARFVYYKDGLSLYQDVKFTGTTVVVPVLSNISYVLVGVYAGNLHTTTPAKVLCDRSILCGDPLEVLTPEEKAKLQAQIGDLANLETENKSSLVAAINEAAQSGGGGLTAAAQTLLRTLLSAAVYDSDVLPNPAAIIESLMTELAKTVVSGDSSGGSSDEEDSGGDSAATKYTVVYTLSGVTSSNTVSSVTEGNSFTTVLSADTEIDNDTVSVKMGGVDITATAYNSASGIITISEVTGDIEISAACADTSLLYRLKDASFNGQTIVDTGVALFDEPKDFTILFDFVDIDCSSNGAAYMGLAEDDTVTDSYQYFVGRTDIANKNADTETVAFNLKTAGMSMTAPTQASDSTSRTYSAKLAVTFDSASNQWTGRIRNTETGESAESAGTGATATIANTIVIGGTAYRGKTSFTCNEFSIYNRVLSADEISAWMQ